MANHKHAAGPLYDYGQQRWIEIDTRTDLNMGTYLNDAGETITMYTWDDGISAVGYEVRDNGKYRNWHHTFGIPDMMDIDTLNLLTT